MSKQKSIACGHGPFYTATTSSPVRPWGIRIAGWGFNLCYLVAGVLVLPWIVWRAIRQGKYRCGWVEKLWGCVSAPPKQLGRDRVWIHAVSVGEVLQLGTIVTGLRVARPDWEIVISTTTQTGHAVAREKFPTLPVFFFPFDFSWAVSRALQRIQPDMMVFVELELWPNFLNTCFTRQIPTALINGRLSERSFRGYQRIRCLLQPVWRQLTIVAAQTAEYRDRFLVLGIPLERLHVTGSIKFDGVQSDRQHPRTQQLRALFQLQTGEITWIAGSTQAPEEEYCLKTYQELRREFPKLRLILAPRHPQRFDEVAARICACGLPLIRRSKGGTVEGAIADQPAVGLLDTLGELATCWGLAEIAFVGGSLTRRGGQNLIEPAAYGAAVLTGPNTWNFRAVVELLQQANALKVVHDPEELTAAVSHWLTDSAARIAAGTRASAAVLTQQGATQRTIDILLRIVS